MFDVIWLALASNIATDNTKSLVDTSGMIDFTCDQSKQSHLQPYSMWVTHKYLDVSHFIHWKLTHPVDDTSATHYLRFTSRYFTTCYQNILQVNGLGMMKHTKILRQETQWHRTQRVCAINVPLVHCSIMDICIGSHDMSALLSLVNAFYKLYCILLHLNDLKTWSMVFYEIFW